MTSIIANLAMGADPAAISTWFFAVVDSMTARIQAGYAINRNSAMTYLRQHGALHGAQVTPMPGSLDVAALRKRLEITGPIGFKSAIAAGQDTDQALRHMATNMAGVADENVRNGDRHVITRTAEYGRGVVGWRRRLSGRGCGFCAMLASRGAVYVTRASAGLSAHSSPYHPHCHCWAEPLYEHQQEPREVRDLQSQWKRITAGETGNDKAIAWRRHWEQRATPTARARYSIPEPGAARTAGAVSPVQVRQLLADAQSPAAVSRVLETEYFRLTGRRELTADLRGSVATAREHAEGVLRFVERYPDTSIRFVRTGQIPGAYAQGDRAAGEIVFSDDWSSVARRQDYLDATAADARAGWHPHGTGDPAGIAAHETGHLRAPEDLTDDLDALLADTPEKLVRSSISGYAATDYEELVAEAFADVVANGDLASDLSKAVVRVAEGHPGGVTVGGPRFATPRPPSPTVLRKRVTDAGITVPTGLRPDALRQLVADLDKGIPAQQARETALQTIVEERRAVASLVSQVDEALYNEASDRALASLAVQAERLPAELKQSRTLAAALRGGDVDLTGARGLSTAADVRAVQIENRIRQAYNELPQAQGAYVMLSDLRAHPLLRDLPRSEVDAALVRGGSKNMQLTAWDNRRVLTARDNEAAIDFGQGATREAVTYRKVGMQPGEPAPMLAVPGAGVDREAIRRAADDLAKASKLSPAKGAAAGDVVALDRTTMTVLGDAGERNGTLMFVVRPGYTTTVERRALTLERAGVQPATVEQIARARAATPVKAAKATAKAVKATPAKKVPAPKAPPAPVATVSRQVDELKPGDRIFVRERRSDGEIVAAPSGGKPVTVVRIEQTDPHQTFERTIWATDEQGNEVIIASTAVETRGSSGYLNRYDKIRVEVAAPTKATKAAPVKAAPAPERMTPAALKTELQPVIDAAPDQWKLTAADLKGVPPKTLQRWVERSRTLQPGQLGEEVGRWRQTIIDRRNDLADLLAEADQLVANGASAATLGQRGAGALRLWEAKAEGWPELASARVLVTAMQTGNPTRIRAAIKAAQRKAGLKQIGEDAGKLTKFDRSMKPIGGAIPEGADVKVVKPGYEIEVGGQRIVLSKPTVEAAPLPPTQRPIRELLASPAADREQALRSVFEGKFGRYTTKVKTGGTADKVFVDGKIYDAKGFEIGRFGRTVEITDDGEVWVHNGILELDSAKFQGTGFAREFNAKAMDWYRASGVDGVYLDAVDIGRYAWASQGFDFATIVDADHALEHLQDMVTALRTGRTKDMYGKAWSRSLLARPDLEQQIAQAEDVLRRMETLPFGDPGYPTAREISQIGRWPGAGKADRWLGKELMLRTSWSGVLKLR